MSRFRTLVENLYTEKDYNPFDISTNKKDRDIFLMNNGISPAILYDNLILYDDADQGYLTVKAIPKEKVIVVKPVEEVYNDEFNVYSKKYGDPIEMPIDTYRETLYNNEKNQDNIWKYINRSGKYSLDTNEYTQNINRIEKDRIKVLDDFYKRNDAKLFNILGIDPDKKDYEQLEKIYKKIKHGHDFEDLLEEEFKNLPIIKVYLNKVKEQLKKDNDLEDEDKKVLNSEFNDIIENLYYEDYADIKNMRELRKAVDENGEQILAYLGQEWKRIQDDNRVEESCLVEAETELVSDAYEVKQLLKGLDIDPKFMTVSIVDDPSGFDTEHYEKREDDPFALPLNKFIISGINVDKISKKPVSIRVKGSAGFVGGKNYEIEEIRELTHNEDNIDSQLDVPKFRQDMNGTKTLNPGIGKYYEIPQAVIMTMLKTLENENRRYAHLNITGKYLKSLEKHEPNGVVTDALNDYNEGDNRRYKIRAFLNANNTNGFYYAGWIPNDINSRGKPAMSKRNNYMNVMKY